MQSINFRRVIIVFLAILSVGLASPANLHADVVLTASGANTFVTNEFFRFDAPDLPSGVTISGFSIDLQGGSDPNDFWDADQVGGNSPWGFRNGTGITATDITFNPAPGTGPPNTSILDINFAPGTMAAGDSFTFDFDTDFTITDGDEFAAFGVTVELRLSDGSIFNTVFSDDGIANDTSAASFAFAVPEPTHAVVIIGLGCFAAGMRRRRRS